MEKTIALVGNPNCGKTTLFNHLTGSNQYVGNWPGVTVEQKQGLIKKRNVKVMDLPGIYSLSPYSNEEVITRKYIIEEKPDVIISIIDGVNIERNLYLTMQVMELGRPMVLAINMMDEVEANGGHIDVCGLAKTLGVPVVPISAKNGEGIEKLIDTAINCPKVSTLHIFNANTIETHDKIALLIAPFVGKMPLSFASLKIMEGDEVVRKALQLEDKINDVLDGYLQKFIDTSKFHDIDMILPDERYTFITSLVERYIVKGKKKITVSDKIDRIMTNRILGLPLFFGLMGLMFYLTFGSVGTFLSEILSSGFEGVVAFFGNLLVGAGAPSWFYGLIIDGGLRGVAGILGFLPQILILFFFLSLLEDTGYMARVAFIMDRPLRRLGLSGKSFIPMIMGFGCTTPAVMTARTMENEDNKKMTILLTPFMSCGAKLPIYALFAGAFFAKNQTIVIFSMYILGIVVAIISGIILKRLFFKDSHAPFVMELPQYRMPTLKGTFRQLYDKARNFVVKAGSIILAMSIVVWFLQSYNFALAPVSDNALSIMGSIGRFIAPIFEPLGFSSWQASVSLISGLAAKEAVVSTASVLYGFGTGNVTAVLSNYFTPLSAYSFMAFTLLYIPCVSAFANIKRELNSWKWAFLSGAWMMGSAYIVSLLIFQIGKVIGLS